MTHLKIFLSVNEALEAVFAELKTFIGKAKQHNDMTNVVVKIT
ncbi:MAG TPA: hypothetical protein VGB10_01045 [Bacteroidota bacterium]